MASGIKPDGTLRTTCFVEEAAPFAYAPQTTAQNAIAVLEGCVREAINTEGVTVRDPNGENIRAVPKRRIRKIFFAIWGKSRTVNYEAMNDAFARSEKLRLFFVGDTEYVAEIGCT